MQTYCGYRLSEAPPWSAAILKEKSEWLFLSAIVALGVALRWWSPAMRSDLWYDEMCSYTVAARPFGSMMHILYLGADTNPPLYTVLLHFWLKLGSSDNHIKVLSLIFATASIVALYVLARRIGGRYAALLACSLMAASPTVIIYSVEARPYAMFLFFSLLSTCFLWSAVQESTRRVSRLWLGFSIASVLTVYTHWFGLLLLTTQASALAICCYPRFRHIVRPYLISLMAIGCCCLPLALFLRNQIASQSAVGGYSWPGKPGLRSIANLAAFFAGGENLLGLVALVGVIVWLSRRNRILQEPRVSRQTVLFLATYLALPVLVVFTISNLLSNNSFFVNRYFMPFVMSVNILTALGLSRLDRRIAFALISIFVLLPLVKTAKHWGTPETPYSQTASELSIQSRDDVLIAHLSPMSYYSMLHYRGNHGATERILCLKSRGGYETAYNLDGEMLTGDDLMEVGAALRQYKELWVIIDPMDRDKELREAYDYIRNNGDFVLESEKQIRGLRLEHYTLRDIALSRLALRLP